jgi:hypothetical protein
MAQAGGQEGSSESHAEMSNARGEVTEEELAECLASQVPRERQHAEHAIAAAKEVGFFHLKFVPGSLASVSRLETRKEQISIVC